MDIGLIADPTRCPDCALVLTDSPAACAACGLPLRGPLADQLWQVSVAAARLLEDRRALIGALRGAPLPGRVPVVAQARPWHPGPPPQVGLATPKDAWVPPQRTAWVDQAPLTRDPATPRQVQRMLLSLGVLLLVVAALIFTVVAWGRIGIGGRSAILGALTAAAGYAGSVARRRELPGTAEALATLTLAFLLIDAGGLRSAGVAGLDEIPADGYWAAVLALLAAVAAGLWKAYPLNLVRYTAVVFAQLPLIALEDRLPLNVFAALLVVQGALAVPTARRLAGTGVRIVVAGGGGLAYLTGLGVAATLAYGGQNVPLDERVPLATSVALLLFCSLAAVSVAWAARAVDLIRQGAAAAATACLLFAIHAPLQHHLDHRAATAWGAAALLAAVAVLCAVPRGWLPGPLTVVAVAAAGAFADVAEPAGRVVSGALGWAEQAWTQDAGASAQDRLTTAWTGTGAVPLTLALLTAGAGLVAWRLRSAAVLAVAACLGTGTAVVLPVALDAPYLLAVLLYVAVGGALLTAAVRVYTRPAEAPAAEHEDRLPWSDRDAAGPSAALALAAAGLAAVGGLAVALGLVWSLASRAATGWALVVALAAAVAAHAADRRADRPVTLAAAVALLVAETYVLVRLADAPPARAGFAAVVAAGALAVAAIYLTARHRAGEEDALTRRQERGAAQVAAVFAGALAFVPVVDDAGWTAHALLAAGTAAGLVALRPDRRQVAWLGGLLLAASSWIRLAQAHVETPEAYTTGPAIALLAAGWWSRRTAGDAVPQRSSWSAYTAGLVTGLLPSLGAVLVDGDDLTRPFLLGAAALAVLLVGTRARLQAPLVIGGTVLALDALIQLGPVAAALPRWVTVGGTGVLLLCLGATFEARLRNLRRLREKLDTLG